MKTVIFYKDARDRLNNLGYKTAPVRSFQSNKFIYKADLDIELLPIDLRSELFEGVTFTATRPELERLRERGVENLFKAGNVSLVLFLKPLGGEIPPILLPYLNPSDELVDKRLNS